MRQIDRRSCTSATSATEERRARAGLSEGSRVVWRGGSRSAEDAGQPHRDKSRRRRSRDFRQTARSLARRETPAPKPRKRGKSGGDGKGYGKRGALRGARDLRTIILNLCQQSDEGFAALAGRGQEGWPRARAASSQLLRKEASSCSRHKTDVPCGKRRRAYAASHCRIARRVDAHGKEGGKLTVCLLDREPVSGRYDGLRSVSRRKRRISSRALGGERGFLRRGGGRHQRRVRGEAGGLRRRLPRWQIPAAMRGFTEQRAVALRRCETRSRANASPRAKSRGARARGFRPRRGLRER